MGLSAAREKPHTPYLKSERTNIKIAFTGLDLPEGRFRFEDPVVHSLTAKFSPKKVTPYYFEFIGDDFEAADITPDTVLEIRFNI